jgi:glycosyltransferase involved in cell wall biosynthesis
VRLSVIVPSFNQGRFIASTLESIFEQDVPPFEVIVVDGASADETVDILRAYGAGEPRLRWLSEPDEGVADAVNKGLALARGDIGAIQSSDDIYYAGAFAAVARTFDADPECGFVIGNYRGITADGQPIYTSKLPAFSWEAYFGMALCIPQSSIFFRMSVARAVGGWNAKYYGCDLDYWLRLLLRTKARRIDDVLSGWRIYGGQRTSSGQQRKIWDGYWQMIEDCAELATAPPRVRRLARASRHILALRHHPTGDRWAVRGHALLAMLQHPTFWRYQEPENLRRLVPGYGRTRAMYRRLRPSRGTG